MAPFRVGKPAKLAAARGAAWARGVATRSPMTGVRGPDTGPSFTVAMAGPAAARGAALWRRGVATWAAKGAATGVATWAARLGWRIWASASGVALPITAPKRAGKTAYRGFMMRFRL